MIFLCVVEKEVQIKEAADGPFVTEPNKRGLRTIIVNRCSLIKHSATCCLPPSKRFCCIFLELTDRISLDWIEIWASKKQTDLSFIFSCWMHCFFYFLQSFKMSLFFVSTFSLHDYNLLSGICLNQLKLLSEKSQVPIYFLFAASLRMAKNNLILYQAFQLRG